jgi:hypothetical protein
MVQRCSLIPGISKFIDENVLAQYPASSMKRILMAGAVSLYLKQNEGVVESMISNPLFTGLGVVKEGGLIDIEPVRDVLKAEINKAGFMRVSIPIIGDIDFTTEDVDALYKSIIEANTQITKPLTTSNQLPVINNGGIY